MKLVFATNNTHKLEEVQAMISGLIDLKSLNDIGCFTEIPETGMTLEENSGQKSQFIYDRYQLNCFGDDSGLEIESLNNEPGVYSASYSGIRDAEANLQLVLKKLDGSTNRKARFRTVISLIIEGSEYLFDGTINGEITIEKSGIKGFGYDPIFKPDGYNLTFAEMSADQKNAISHRAIALKKMITFLKANA